jgi:hypothetical protein
MSHAGILVNGASALTRRYAAEPVVRPAVELNAGLAQKLLQEHLRIEGRYVSAVFAQTLVHQIGGHKTPGSRTILDDESWITRDVPPQVARHDTGAYVVAAAGRETDNDSDGFTAVKISGRFLVETGRLCGGAGARLWRAKT